ncbi:19_t:CDS:2 [Acaulospora colombiana]|uniref:19_t:CDS:1 n=1 Tax=Acaulospora colombiana TaxID=27376 RepID=A0ACA9PGG8_9GLOM|nr:19_t:CDS:2 [Acaulospora colombiana]
MDVKSPLVAFASFYRTMVVRHPHGDSGAANGTSPAWVDAFSITAGYAAGEVTISIRSSYNIVFILKNGTEKEDIIIAEIVAISSIREKTPEHHKILNIGTLLLESYTNPISMPLCMRIS